MNARCSVSLPAGSTLDQVVLAITEDWRKYGIAIPDSFPLLRNRRLSGPQSYHGPIADALREALDVYPEPFRFQILDERLLVYTPGGVPECEGPVHEVSAERGMIGRPVVAIGRLEVTTLLNPAIKPLSLVRVKSAGPEVRVPATTAAFEGNLQIPRTDGTVPLRVIQVNHDGETRGKSWYTRLVAIIDESVSQTAAAS